MIRERPVMGAKIPYPHSGSYQRWVKQYHIEALRTSCVCPSGFRKLLMEVIHQVCIFYEMSEILVWLFLLIVVPILIHH